MDIAYLMGPLGLLGAYLSKSQAKRRQDWSTETLGHDMVNNSNSIQEIEDRSER
jgi:hypothetical protein